jgi:hypothetical protein
MLTYADVCLHLYTGASAEEEDEERGGGGEPQAGEEGEDEHDDEEERERDEERGGGGEPEAGEEGEEEEEEEEEEERESERERVQDAWVEKGRRKVDFVGNLLSADARTSGMLTSGMQSQVCKAPCSRLTRAPQVC